MFLIPNYLEHIILENASKLVMEFIYCLYFALLHEPIRFMHDSAANIHESNQNRCGPCH